VLALQTNSGTTAVTIDTSQNVGIGTTSPTSFSGYTVVDAYNGTTGAFVLVRNPTKTGQFTVDTNGVRAGSRTNDFFALVTNDTERVRIDTSGNVGIGTTSPSTRLHVQGGQVTDGGLTYNQQLTSTAAYNATPAAGSLVSLQYTSGGSYAGMGGWSINKENATSGDYAGYMAFFTRPNGGSTTERMRITSAGDLVVGKTATGIGTQGFGAYSTGEIEANAGTNPAAYFNRTNDGTIVQFRRSGTTVGTISVTTSATAYNTSSDYRLKENIAPMTGALAKVAQLKPVTYKWKANGSNGEGFIAHELAEVCPHAVSGEKDAVDEDGKPVYQGIDVSFLVATLTAAIQELKAINDTQAETINALTARIVALEGV
jgi:hypothetical protein